MPDRRGRPDEYDAPRRRSRRSRSGPPVALIVGLVFGSLFLLAAAGVAIFLIVGTRSSSELATDLQQLQGTWEGVVPGPDGRTPIRKVKVIRGNTEQVTWYAADGSVDFVNTVEFDLALRGRDKEFRYFNGRVTAGPEAGRRFASGSFVYMLAGDTWTEFDPSGRTLVWTRVQDKGPR